MISIPIEDLPQELRDSSPEKLVMLIKIGYGLFQQSAPVSIGQVAAVIGQIGEQRIREIYESKYIIDDVSKQGRKGDIILKRPATPEHPVQHQILTEVKNYTTAVGTAEVDKFYRDLVANSAIVGGIFISINTKIVGIPDDFYFTTRGDTPVVFVSLRNLSESVAGSITLLAADLLWAFIDSRHLVDDRIFQKLSKKITRLSDSINNLSLSRTFINETRQMMDKQMNKIYESILTTELQMYNTIMSINKTIGGNDVVEPTGEQLVIANPMIYTPLDVLVTANFPTSIYNTSKVYRTAFHKILDKYFEYCDEESLINLEMDKKNIILKHVDQKLITLSFLKARTDLTISLLYEPSTIEVPGISSFSNNCIIFQLDKTLTTSGSLETIFEYIETLESSEQIGISD